MSHITFSYRVDIQARDIKEAGAAVDFMADVTNIDGNGTGPWHPPEDIKLNFYLPIANGATEAEIEKLKEQAVLVNAKLAAANAEVSIPVLPQDGQYFTRHGVVYTDLA